MVLIDSSVTAAISSERDRRKHNFETGGLLLGYRKANDLHVTNCTTQKKNDECGKYYFARNDYRHQLIATAHWLKSGLTCDWVGEWHTHPVPIALPSSIDQATWNKQVKTRGKRMFYLILGSEKNWYGLVCPKRSEPNELFPINLNDKFTLLASEY